MRRTISTSMVLAVLLCFVLAAPASDQPASAVSSNDHGDATLKAMLSELKRSQEKLQLGQLQRPYYIDYQVTEYQDYSSDAILGALLEDQTSIGRVVRVVVRIGDYKQDSYFGDGQGTLEGMIPIDDNQMALRHQLWLATDKAYKAALGGLSEKQAALKNVQVENEIADFSQEKPTELVQPVAGIDVDRNAWREKLRVSSDLFRSDPLLERSDATLNCRILNRYFVNTEGTVTRNGRAVYTLAISGSTQANDGMRLERSQGYVVGRLDELPKPEELKKDAHTLIGTFAALRSAPVMEDDYHGPVLFSADAATALFERLIVPNILGIHPDLGNPARTNGEFASYYKSRVMPDFFTVVDDPRPLKIDGQTLVGSYDVDDEGVKAQTVTVIDKGVLVNYLMSRDPIRDFGHSNGHGRSGYAGNPRAQISNLIFKAVDGVSFEDLKKRLIGMCRDQGRPYGYYVETTGLRLAPRLLWRVYVKDGHMELVRGANFNQLDTRTLRSNIIAAGNDTYVYNRRDPVPSSIVAPSLLFDDLEIQRLNRAREKLPTYAAPALVSEEK
ncbi:MAG TPA: metallopeptidase TldD-related protein [Candidatus Saccharimonadales bacterium]|jgi:TldD protein|nr:metallopeptidase TldD-related protein [Candidatus Saccharimonadales bacterium]